MPFVYQGKNDCAIVSIANYTGHPYDRVLQAAMLAGLTPEHIKASGTPQERIPVILAHLTGKIPIVRKPRRGTDKLTALASWHHPNRSNGHMNVIIDGHVLDTTGISYPIEVYRRVFNYNLRLVIYIP